MQMRELGRSGLQVSAIGLGCMGISFSYATHLSKDEGVKLIRGAVEISSALDSTLVVHCIRYFVSIFPRLAGIP